MTEKIKIHLLEDHDIVRQGLKSLFAKEKNMEVAAESSSLEDFYSELQKIEADVYILDLKLPDGKGSEACREIKQKYKKAKILVLTAYSQLRLLNELIEIGVDGYLLKDIDSKKIISSVNAVVNGDSYLDPKSAAKVFDLLKDKNKKEEQFTAKEKQILDLLTEGKSNKEIVDKLFLAEKTIRNQLSKIFKKINVDNRTEAAIYWLKYQEIS